MAPIRSDQGPPCSRRSQHQGCRGHPCADTSLPTRLRRYVRIGPADYRPGRRTRFFVGCLVEASHQLIGLGVLAGDAAVGACGKPAQATAIVEIPFENVRGSARRWCVVVGNVAASATGLRCALAARSGGTGRGGAGGRRQNLAQSMYVVTQADNCGAACILHSDPLHGL